MILISGTFLDVQSLPNYEIMDYNIDNEHMDIKLKTVAKQSACFQVYLAEDRKAQYTITPDIESKIIYFKDDDDLYVKLSTTSDDIDAFKEEPEKTEIDEVPEVPEFEPPVQSTEEEPAPETVEVQPTITTSMVVESESTDEDEDTEKSEKDENGIEEQGEEKSTEVVQNEPIVMEIANTELPDEISQIPFITDDTDSLKEQIKVRERVIAQKDGMIMDLKKNMDDIYKTQEIQLLELQNTMMAKLEQAQQQIEEYKSKASNVSISEEAMQFLKYASYAQTCKAVSREGFTEVEKAKMGRMTSPIKIFACATGDSSYSLLKQVKLYIDKEPESIVVDFSNDNFLCSSLKIKGSQTNSTNLLKNDIDIPSIAKDLKGTRYIPTTNFNDISLLIADWSVILRNLNEYAGGRPIIMIFGSINNFNVRSTVSKLSSIEDVDLYIFAKCSPIILSTLYSDIQFIPKDRFTLIALEYIEVVKTILSSIAQKYSVIAFANDVEWQKLGLR